MSKVIPVDFKNKIRMSEEAHRERVVQDIKRRIEEGTYSPGAMAIALAILRRLN